MNSTRRFLIQGIVSSETGSINGHITESLDYRAAVYDDIARPTKNRGQLQWHKLRQEALWSGYEIARRNRSRRPRK